MLPTGPRAPLEVIEAELISVPGTAEFSTTISTVPKSPKHGIQAYARTGTPPFPQRLIGPIPLGELAISFEQFLEKQQLSAGV